MTTGQTRSGTLLQGNKGVNYFLWTLPKYIIGENSKLTGLAPELNTGRQAHGESRPGLFRARHFNRAAVRLDNRLGNSEAKSGVARAGARLLGAKKSAKHAWQIFGGNPLPGVRHRQHGETVLRFQFHAYFAAGLVVLNSVGQQIRDDLRQSF